MISVSEIRVVDDTDKTIVLDEPAKRIISLAPHVTELLFAAGAGEQVIAVSAYSNYPQQAQSLPVISAGTGLDIERIIAMQPDLVIAWKSGNPAAQVTQLEQLGLQVFYSEPREIDAVAETLQRFGHLSGHVSQADEAASEYREQVTRLRSEYKNKKPVSVFYQVWQKPLMTINGQHMISHWLALCGGKNVFMDLPGLVPVVNTESVLVANPEVIVTGGYAGQDNNWRDLWNRWPKLAAVEQKNMYTVPAETMDRQTPRAVFAARELCEKIDKARRNYN
jgi:iron complex transport system substrate-binding protein